MVTTAQPLMTKIGPTIENNSGLMPEKAPIMLADAQTAIRKTKAHAPAFAQYIKCMISPYPCARGAVAKIAEFQCSLE